MINGNDKRVASSIASSKRNPSCLTFPSSPCHSYFQTLHLVLFFAIGLSFYRPVFRPLTGRGRFKQVLTPEQYEQFVSVFPSPYEVRSFQTNSDNQKWAPIAKQVLKEAAKTTSDGETVDLGGIPASVTKMAHKAGMTDQDLLNFIQGVCGKPWAELSGPEKNTIIEQLQGLSQ